MHFTMSENILARKGEQGWYFTRPNPKFTRQCERAVEFNTLEFSIKLKKKKTFQVLDNK